jgi:hypothetical protein
MNTFLASVFWDNFWPNFWANLTVGVIITSVIGWIIKVSKTVKLELTVKFRNIEGGEQVAEFGISNSGKISIKPEEVFYHIFIVEDDVPQGIKANLKHNNRITIANVKYIDFSGKLDEPIFPGRATKALTVSYTKDRNGTHEIPYYLSTMYGLFPKTMTLNQSTGVALHPGYAKVITDTSP